MVVVVLTIMQQERTVVDKVVAVVAESQELKKH